MFDVIYVLASDVLYVMWFVLVIRQSLSSSLASAQFRVGQQFEGPVTFTFYLLAPTLNLVILKSPLCYTSYPDQLLQGCDVNACNFYINKFSRLYFYICDPVDYYGFYSDYYFHFSFPSVLINQHQHPKQFSSFEE